MPSKWGKGMRLIPPPCLCGKIGQAKNREEEPKPLCDIPTGEQKNTAKGMLAFQCFDIGQLCSLDRPHLLFLSF
jgi:hypothetical protein